MKLNPRFSALLSIQFGIFSAVYGQVPEVDSNYYNKALQNVIAIYENSLAEKSPIYNGRAYVDYPPIFSEEHPYFKSADWELGSIVYDGTLYEDVPLQYDLVRDQVVLRYVNGVSRINLRPDKVQEFFLSGHHFVRIGEDSSHTGISSGFYDLLYRGKTTVLAKRTKNIQKFFRSGGSANRVFEKDFYYVKTADSYTQVRNKNSFLKEFRIKKNILMNRISEQKIDFRENFESAMIQTAGFYDQITENP